jgi:hypothetical protein
MARLGAMPAQRATVSPAWAAIFTRSQTARA